MQGSDKLRRCFGQACSFAVAALHAVAEQTISGAETTPGQGRDYENRKADVLYCDRVGCRSGSGRNSVHSMRRRLPCCTYSRARRTERIPWPVLLRILRAIYYGTTQLGGSTAGVCATITGFNNINGCGTVFEIDTTGVESILYRFTGGTDGEFPASGLVIDGTDNLYGTTPAAVFKLDKAGKLTTLHSPGAYAGLAMDPAGILFGSSADGIFSLDPSSGEVLPVLAPGVGSNAPFGSRRSGESLTGLPDLRRARLRAELCLSWIRRVPTQRCTPSRNAR